MTELWNAAEPPVPARGPGLGSAVVLALIGAYKLLLSPLFMGSCRFQPSCADYMAEAVRTHGARQGVWLGLARLVRCRPYGGHGFDPVPERPDLPEAPARGRV